MDIDWIGRAQALTLRVRNFIDGRFYEPRGQPLVKYGPRDGRLLCQYGTGEGCDVDEAVASARRAFEDGRWSGMSVRRRQETLYRLCSLIEGRQDELALLECLDVGKPITDALSFDVPAAVANVRFSAEAADKLCSKVYAADQTSLSYGLRRPAGVVAGIVGWNFPLCLAAQKIGPALAVGNCIVLKPSEVTSLSASRLAEMAVEAGVPEGVLNVVHGNASVGAALARHHDVNLVSFTGSSFTGRALLTAAGQSNMKNLILECGGKSPNIVFADCPDLDAVAAAIVASAFWNQGQVCVASSRLLVQDGVKEELLKIVIEQTRKLEMGDPLKPATKFGALVSQNHKSKVVSYIEGGEQEGAQLIYSSSASPPHAQGFYVPPTIFDRVTSRQRLAQEEIFGPVLSVSSFRDEEEAIRIANETIYGLSAIVWTKDLGRAHRLSRSIDVGWLIVKATDRIVGGPSEGVLPIGGHKQSGLGVEGGLEGLGAYMKKTAIQYFV